jgi:hypothetical protein
MAYDFLNNQVWKKLYIIIAAICFIPFFYHLYPRAAVANRSYEEILTMLPTFIDYINVGSSNWWWGFFNSEELRSRPMWWETR